jgi:hypothetical protein
MAFLIEESIDTPSLTVGDQVDLTWRIPYDRPKSDVTITLSPGLTLSGDDLEKSNIGQTDEWGSRDTYEYRVERVELEATFTTIQAETYGAAHTDHISAEPRLTSC